MAPAIAVDVGAPAPVVEAPLADGTMMSLSVFRGQVVYIDFWASWCAPCLEALPALEALYRQYRDQGFSVLAVNVDTDRRAADRLLRRIPVSYPVVFDPAGTWPGQFAIKGMPSGYLLDRDGRVLMVKSGYRRKDFPKLETALTKALEATP